MDRRRSKNRKSIEAQCDIISDLPRDVLYRIMECLPIRDAARMSVLSHKWQDIWTSIPYLKFDRSFFLSLKKQMRWTLAYSNIVSKILLHHEGAIVMFSMDLPRSTPIPDTAPWISYLSRNGVKEFSLSNAAPENLKLSSRLFSFGGLETLKLVHCMFSGPPNFEGFPKLAILELVSVFLSCNTFKVLLNNCPVLQKLNMRNCTGLEHTNFLIDAPKLQTLILDWNFQSVELKSCENLVSASISISSSNVHSKTSICGLLKVLANSSKLERLCLGGDILMVFSKQLSLHSFVRLRILELQSLHLNNLDDYLSLTRCVQSLSNIETLKINVIPSSKLDEHVLDFNPHCTLNQLRFATVELSNGSIQELNLVEFLLACSPVLKKLSVLPTKQVTKSSLSRILVLLNRFRRVSPKVELIFLEPRKPVAYVSAVSPLSSSSDDRRIPAALVSATSSLSSSSDDTSSDSSTTD